MSELHSSIQNVGKRIRQFHHFASVPSSPSSILSITRGQILNSQFREIASFPGVLLIVLGENRLIKIHLSDVPFPYLSLSRVHIRRENQGINHRVRRSRYLLIIIIHYTNIFQMTRLFRSFYFPPYIYRKAWIRSGSFTRFFRGSRERLVRRRR